MLAASQEGLKCVRGAAEVRVKLGRPPSQQPRWTRPAASTTAPARSTRGCLEDEEERRSSHSRSSSSRSQAALDGDVEGGGKQQRVQRGQDALYINFSEQASSSGAMHGEQCDCAEPLLWEPPSRQDHSQLTLSIMGCESTSSLLELLIHHQARMNGIHLSAALHRAIKLYRQEAQRPSWRTARMITGALLPLLTTELQSLMPSLAQQPHVVASVAHALGCLDVRDRDLLGGLAGLAQGCMTDISTQGLANILWAFARCEYQPSAGWMSAYVCACCARMSAFRPQELAMVLWGLSKLKYKLSPDMQQNFLGRARALFPSMGPQALCMLVYGLSMTGHHPGEAWLDSFVEAALQPPGLRRFTPQGFSQMLWALSRIGYKPSPEVACTIQDYLSKDSRMQNFKSIDVATTLYALGRMQLPMSRDLMRLLLDKLDAHMFSFQPSQLANAGWALARLQLQLRQLRQWQHAVQQAEGQQLQPLRHELHPAHCNGTPTTLQQLPQAGDEPQPPAARRHTHAADACSRQQLEFPFPTSVLRRFLSACYISLDRFTSLDLSMTCWALATLRVAPPQSFLTVFLRRVEQVGAEFAPQEVANTLWALARIGAKPSAPVMAEFFIATDRRLSSFKPHELSSMAWALAKMGFTPDKAWADEFLRATFHKLPSLGSQGLTNVIWALAVMPLRPPPAWLYAFVKAVSAEKAMMRCGDLVLVSNSLRSLTQGSQLLKVDECIAELAAASQLAPQTNGAVLLASASTSQAAAAQATLANVPLAEAPLPAAPCAPAATPTGEAWSPPSSSHGANASRQDSGARPAGVEGRAVAKPGAVQAGPPGVPAIQGLEAHAAAAAGQQGEGAIQGSGSANLHQLPSRHAMQAMQRAEMVRAVSGVGITHQQASLIAAQQAKRRGSREGGIGPAGGQERRGGDRKKGALPEKGPLLPQGPQGVDGDGLTVSLPR